MLIDAINTQSDIEGNKTTFCSLCKSGKAKRSGLFLLLSVGCCSFGLCSIEIRYIEKEASALLDSLSFWFAWFHNTHATSPESAFLLLFAWPA